MFITILPEPNLWQTYGNLQVQYGNLWQLMATYCNRMLLLLYQRHGYFTQNKRKTTTRTFLSNIAFEPREPSHLRELMNCDTRLCCDGHICFSFAFMVLTSGVLYLLKLHFCSTGFMARIQLVSLCFSISDIAFGTRYRVVTWAVLFSSSVCFLSIIFSNRSHLPLQFDMYFAQTSSFKSWSQYEQCGCSARPLRWWPLMTTPPWWRSLGRNAMTQSRLRYNPDPN